jgi:hypothetical protein
MESRMQDAAARIIGMLNFNSQPQLGVSIAVKN